MSDLRRPVEFAIVDRAGGWVRDGPCGSCGEVRPLPFGLFVGSSGEACGAVELCADCAPNAERLASNIADLAPDAAAMLGYDEATGH